MKIVNGLDPDRVMSSICSTAPGDPAMCAAVSPRVPVIQLQRRPGNDPGIVWALYRVLRRERPDVVHTHAWGTLLEGLIAARLARVPAIVHGEHGTLAARPRQLRVQRWAWRRVDRVLSVSSRLAERISRDVGFPLADIQVIRNGVDLTRFRGTPSASARATFGFPDDGALVIGAVGRLVEVKDHATFIDAIALLRSHGHRVRAVIAGDGPLRNELAAHISRAGLDGVIALLGHRPDAEEVFSGIDVFVQSSRSEGMSNTILEAMASGLPVVATRVGGADEMVIDNETGVLVPSANPPAMSAALERLLTSESARHAMGRAGRDRAQVEFSLARMIERYQSFYCDLVQRTVASRREAPAVSGVACP
jgi:sugar transferase (PEP-CTERM/EpsH1 system associated)